MVLHLIIRIMSEKIELKKKNENFEKVLRLQFNTTILVIRLDIFS